MIFEEKERKKRGQMLKERAERRREKLHGPKTKKDFKSMVKLTMMGVKDYTDDIKKYYNKDNYHKKLIEENFTDLKKINQIYSQKIYMRIVS